MATVKVIISINTMSGTVMYPHYFSAVWAKFKIVGTESGLTVEYDGEQSIGRSSWKKQLEQAIVEIAKEMLMLLLSDIPQDDREVFLPLDRQK